jgi:hypothetical protein
MEIQAEGVVMPLLKTSERVQARQPCNTLGQRVVVLESRPSGVAGEFSNRPLDVHAQR